MADFPSSITDFYAGDALTLDPDIPVVDPSAISDAYFMVKINRDDDDADAKVAKHITTSGGDGLLTTNLLASTVNTRFELLGDDTRPMNPLAPWHWEVLLVTASGDDYRAQGLIYPKGQRLIKGL